MKSKLINLSIFFLLILSNPFFSFSLAESNDQINDKNISMFMGDKEAPVIIIEYASFTCPHCATFHTEVLPKLKADYINSGKVLLEYREVYFDGPGLWAGLLARCQGNQRYFPMIDLIFRKQKDWASGNRDDIIKGLLSIGRQSGLTDQKSRDCMENGKLAENLIEIFKKNPSEYLFNFVFDFYNNSYCSSFFRGIYFCHLIFGTWTCFINCMDFFWII